MRTSFLTATLAVAVGVSALPQITPLTPLAPALPLDNFDTEKFTKLLSIEDIAAGLFKKIDPPTSNKGGIDLLASHKAEFHRLATSNTMATAASCSNPRVRIEWDNASNNDRQAYVSAVRCLMGKPASGQFQFAKSRYEDLVALHQILTPNVHGSSKFLLWHRYYLWTFEDVLRSECGFNGPLLWFDETRYSGKFDQSSIFSDQWFGGINAGGNCITNGQFANLAINIGPGSGNQLHCLARNNDNSATANTNQGMVDGCNSQSAYRDMAQCSEGAAHAWGHNGIGAVMSDTYGSPADPVFFLHHAFIDRNFRIWQNQDSFRLGYIDGTDKAGNPLTLDTTVNVYDIRPTVRIRDILDTTSQTLCYKYNY